MNTWVKKEKSDILRIVITNSGLYHFGSLKQGIYQLELNDNNSRKIIIDSVQIIADSVTTLAISFPDLCKFIYSNDFKPVCPKGHSDNIVRIVYGLPNDKMMKKAKKGIIHLGGCLITDCDPKYYCNIHKIEI